MKALAAMLAATTVLGGAVAYSQDANTASTTIKRAAINPPATGVKVVSTPEYYTNNQQTVANIQQSRVQEAGPLPKGATALQSGPRTEIRPPTGFVEPDPWIQQDHPWDIETNLPSIDSPPNP
jgi:hypothetical protein